MQVILRTLPRDDGQVSVVLTRIPGDPRDPEVVNVLPTGRAACLWVAKMALRIRAQAGRRCAMASFDYRLPEFGMCWAKAVLEVGIGDGEELRIIE